MNKFRFTWAALSLLAPVLIFFAICFGPAACSSSGGTVATPAPTAAEVQVSFITSLTGLSPSAVQNFFINVVGVRMNPLPNSKNSATPSETSGKWVVIPVPTATSTGTSPGDVPIDIVAGQSQLQEFNTFNVKSGKFNTIEVVLDTANPGYIVPVCAGGNLEGCVRYPIQIQNSPSSISYVLSTAFQTQQHVTEPLPIQLVANVVSTPSGPGQPYVVGLTAQETDAASYTGTVTGTVTGAKAASSQNSHVRVTAELAGTNTVVASSDAFSGTFSMFLPAAAGVGTLYDFYVSGGTATIVAQRGLGTSGGGVLMPGTTETLDLTVKSGQTIGGFSGQVSDSCTSQPISGATLEILQQVEGDTTTDCGATPQNCVVVATAQTDDNGNYPLAAQAGSIAPFLDVPIGSPSTAYTLMATATGHDPLISTGTAAQGASSGGKAGGHCPPGADTGTCNFPLTTAYMTGTLSLTAAQPGGSKTSVQVVAENSGTSTLVAMLPTPLTLTGGQTSVGFTLNVPTLQPLDVFATAEDLYQGGPDPYPGHTILVQQGVSVPTACATFAPSPALFTGQTMDCVGHGSITGIANNPNGATSVQLLKSGVAITQSSVALSAPMATASASYSFCIPPDDSYTVAKLENGSPTPAAGTSAAVGAMATPMPTNSPCPSTCFSSSGSGCPGVCSNTAGPTL